MVHHEFRPAQAQVRAAAEGGAAVGEWAELYVAAAAKRQHVAVLRHVDGDAFHVTGGRSRGWSGREAVRLHGPRQPAPFAYHHAPLRPSNRTGERGEHFDDFAAHASRAQPFHELQRCRRDKRRDVHLGQSAQLSDQRDGASRHACALQTGSGILIFVAHERDDGLRCAPAIPDQQVPRGRSVPA